MALMPSRSGRLRTAVRAWRKHAADLLEWGMLGRCPPSLDKHLVYSGLVDEAGLFHPSYAGWRAKRLGKILEIYGADFFKGKKVLELGAGHGDLGASLAKLGADVLCLDGRLQNVSFARLKHRKVPRIRFEVFNLENDFSRFGRFDLIIDFAEVAAKEPFNFSPPDISALFGRVKDAGEAQMRAADKQVAQEDGRGQGRHDLHHEHHRVADHQAWIEFPKRVAQRGTKDGWVQQAGGLVAYAGFHWKIPFKMLCRRASPDVPPLARERWLAGMSGRR